MNIIQELKAQREAIDTQIKNIQEACSHPDPALKKNPRSDTGNWDRSQDSYWFECHCTLCDKKWIEPQ
jgi:hypothetical protein